MEFKKLLLLPLIFILPSCGGGGGGDSSSSDTTTSDSSSAPDIYNPDTYLGAKVSNSNLSGRWMFVGGMSYDSSDSRYTREPLRSIVTIIDHGDNTIDVQECINEDTAIETHNVDISGGEITWNEFYAGISLSIINNTLAEGIVNGHGGGTNSAQLIKINDDTSWNIGSLEVNGSKNNEDITINHTDICFYQYNQTGEQIPYQENNWYNDNKSALFIISKDPSDAGSKSELALVYSRFDESADEGEQNSKILDFNSSNFSTNSIFDPTITLSNNGDFTIEAEFDGEQTFLGDDTPTSLNGSVSINF